MTGYNLVGNNTRIKNMFTEISVFEHKKKEATNDDDGKLVPLGLIPSFSAFFSTFIISSLTLPFHSWALSSPFPPAFYLWPNQSITVSSFFFSFSSSFHHFSFIFFIFSFFLSLELLSIGWNTPPWEITNRKSGAVGQSRLWPMSLADGMTSRALRQWGRGTRF